MNVFIKSQDHKITCAFSYLPTSLGQKVANSISRPQHPIPRFNLAPISLMTVFTYAHFFVNSDYTNFGRHISNPLCISQLTLNKYACTVLL